MGRVIALAGMLSVLGACGGGDGSGGGSGRPDTGYGAGQVAPLTPNCVDLCLRIADCAGHLCDEDTNSTRYSSIIPLLSSACQSSCAGVDVANSFTAAQWQCLYHDSCRQVFNVNACHTPNTSYTCN